MLQFNVHKLKSASKGSCLILDKTLFSFCLSQVYGFIQSIEGLVMDYSDGYKESCFPVNIATFLRTQF